MARGLALIIASAYTPKDYASLNVSTEVRELFQYIERYQPHDIELETVLKCFIPEYIPAIGEMDPMVKIPRPDGKQGTLRCERKDISRAFVFLYRFSGLEGFGRTISNTVRCDRA
jgi:Intraflagellar transport complex B protein 46 C terminal